MATTKPARRGGLRGFLQGAENFGRDVVTGVENVLGGGTGGNVQPQTSYGNPQSPGSGDQFGNAATLRLPSGSAASQISQGQQPYQGGYNLQGVSGQSNISQSAPANQPTASPMPSGAQLPQASTQDITAALKQDSADWYQAMASGNTQLADQIHQRAVQLRSQNPGVGPANGYTQSQLQQAGLLPTQRAQGPINVAQSSQPANFSTQGNASVQQVSSGAQPGRITVPGLYAQPQAPGFLGSAAASGRTLLSTVPVSIQPRGPSTGSPTAPPPPNALQQVGSAVGGLFAPHGAPTLPPAPSAVPQVPPAAPTGPTVPGLSPAASTGLPRPSAGLPTFAPTTYNQPTGVPQSPAGTPSGVPTQTATPPPLKLGGPGAAPTGQTQYQQTPQTPQQAQQTMQSGLSDLNSVASQLKAAAPDVQALGLSFLTQYLQQLDATENAWKSQLQAEQKGVDPATQAAIDQLKQDAELQRQQLMDQMNARGLLQSGIVLEMQDRANRNELTQEQQLLGNSLSKILNQLNSGLLSFAQMRMGAIQNIGSQTMQGMLSQGQQDQRNLLQLAGLQQGQNQFNQDLSFRQGEATGFVNGQPTLAEQQFQNTQQQQQTANALNLAKFYTDASGHIYDPTTGKPMTDPTTNQPLTTVAYQQMLASQDANLRNYALNLAKTFGSAPSDIPIPGVAPGTPTQAALNQQNTVDYRNTQQLIAAWRDSGSAPDGLQSLGIQPGTPYYSPSIVTNDATSNAIANAYQIAQTQGPQAALQWVNQQAGNFAAYGVDPAKVVTAINGLSTATTNAGVAQAAQGG